jgi:cellulose synthase/poly-beta-1,6-N-acetylglucosamine synthase-like glycosyltransferase
MFAGVRNKSKHIPSNEQNIELPKFSIIVPAKDEETVIRRCLDGLIELDYPKDKLEIIIVDGNSKDSTVRLCLEFAAKHPKTFKIITEKKSNGKPAALNLGLRFTTGDIVGVFDADSLPERQMLRKVASYFRDPQIKAIQGKTISLNEKRNILTRITAMEEKAWFQTLLSGREKLNLFVPLTGSCQFIRWNILEELGGWDETSLTEDVELAVRLVEKKYLIRYAPDVCSGQETPNGLGDLFKQRVRWYRGYMETALKYGRLLDSLNRKTVDAEISLVGPFMMVISLLSYLNWLFVAMFASIDSLVMNFTVLSIVLMAVSLVSIGVVLAAFERPIKVRNLLWIPSIYAYWLIQICIAGWAFLKLVFRRKRVWDKTVKKGFTTSNSILDVQA